MKCKFCTLSQALWLKLNVMVLSSRLVALGCSPLLRQVKPFTQRLQISQFCFVCLFLAAVPWGPGLVRLGHTWRGAKAFSRPWRPPPFCVSVPSWSHFPLGSWRDGGEKNLCGVRLWGCLLPDTGLGCDGMAVPKISVVLSILYSVFHFSSEKGLILGGAEQAWRAGSLRWQQELSSCLWGEDKRLVQLDTALPCSGPGAL